MGVVDFLRLVNKYGKPSYDAYSGGGSSGGSSGGSDDEQAPAAKQAPSRQAPAPQTRESSTDNNAMSDIIAGRGAQGPGQYYGPSQYYGPNADEPRPELGKYSSMLDAYPDRPDPSWMRTIGVGALSFANAQKPDQVTENIDKEGRISKTIKKGNWEPMDIQEAHTVLQQPYEQELSDYRGKLGARKEAAALERQTLTDKSLSLQRQSTAAKNIAGIGQGQQKIDIAADKARVSAFSAETRRRAEEAHNMTDSQKLQYLQEGKLTIEDIHNAAAMERVNAQQTGATTRERETTAGALKREQEQQAGANQRVGMTGEEARKTKAAPGSSSTGNIPSQRKVADQMTISKIKRMDPKLGQFVHLDPDGFVAVDQPSTNWFGHPTGPTQDQVDEINRILNEGGGGQSLQAPGYTPPKYTPPSNIPPKGQSSTEPAGSGGRGSLQKGVMVKNQTNSKTGEKRAVYSYDGGKTWVPAARQ